MLLRLLCMAAYVRIPCVVASLMIGLHLVFMPKLGSPLLTFELSSLCSGKSHNATILVHTVFFRSEKYPKICSKLIMSVS